MKNVVVLGAGMVGRTIAIDLSKKYSVKSIDKSRENLKILSTYPNIKTEIADLTDEKQIEKQIAEADLVIGAVPGFMGFKTVQTVINAGKNIVDISFFPEDGFLLTDLAKKNNVTVVLDAGVAPGMSNFILGYYNSIMKKRIAPPAM